MLSGHKIVLNAGQFSFWPMPLRNVLRPNVE